MNTSTSVRSAVFAASLFVAAGAAAAVFEDVVVRQMWPWDRNVVVECVVRDVECPSQVNLGLTANGRNLGHVPGSAFTTSRAFLRGGKLQIAFDPRAVPALAAVSDVNSLQVTLSAEAVPAEDLLYVIYDLERPGMTDVVTTEALTNGVWGAWEEAIWTNAKLTPTGKPVWTGVTNDAKYATTHLVMRRIEAGPFPMGYADSADKGKAPPNITQRTVTITRPYYIGVYAVTKKQTRLLTASSLTENSDYPSVNDSYNEIRGAYTAAGAPYDWPNDKTIDPDSFLGKLRGITGAQLDLPTEAQWEKAARAGSAGIYYDGTESSTREVRNAIAWWSGNSDGHAHPVGQLKANNYGLYDTLGNVYEWVLDWQAGAVDIELTDPEGPLAAGASYWTAQGVPKRLVKGAGFGFDNENIALYHRNQYATDAENDKCGWRVAMPATEVDNGESIDGTEGVTIDATPTWSWSTVNANDGVVRWVWPSGASSARLVVTGFHTIVDQILAPPSDSYDLGLAIPIQSRNEQALTIRLTFYNGENAGGDVVQSLEAKGVGILCAAPAVAVSDDAWGRHLGKRAVLPLPSGTETLSIDGETMETGSAPCWFGWSGTSGEHSFQLNDSDAVTVGFCPFGLAIMLR